MSLGDQKDPVVVVWEEEGKSKWVDRVEDNEVMCDLNDRSARHISRDSICTRIEVTQLSWYVDKVMTLGCHTDKTEDGEVVIQEDQDGDLGLQRTELIYVIGPTLKRSPNMKPTTAVLGTLLQES